MDTERALARIDEARELVATARRIYEGSVHKGSLSEYYRLELYVETSDQLRQRLPQILAIGEHVIPGITGAINRPIGSNYSFAWIHLEEGLAAIRGALTTQEETAAILGPAGPRLAAVNLHPWVWHAASDLWDDGHFRLGVLEAYNHIETMAKAKVRIALSGKDLWAQAFSTHEPTPDKPRLRFALDREAHPDRWISRHEGAQRFAMGCAQGIRNWAAHTLDNVAEQEALEYLAALSVLARWVSEASVVG